MSWIQLEFLKIYTGFKEKNSHLNGSKAFYRQSTIKCVQILFKRQFFYSFFCFSFHSIIPSKFLRYEKIGNKEIYERKAKCDNRLCSSIVCLLLIHTVSVNLLQYYYFLLPFGLASIRAFCDDDKINFISRQ